jgi:hypothetical protein
VDVVQFSHKILSNYNKNFDDGQLFFSKTVHFFEASNGCDLVTIPKRSCVFPFLLLADKGLILSAIWNPLLLKLPMACPVDS